MRFVALLSGGKDSVFALREAVRLGHELVAGVHLGRPTARSSRGRRPGGGGGGDAEAPDAAAATEKEEEEESYMYQTAASEALTVLVEECLGVPLVLWERRGRSLNTSLVYDGGHRPGQDGPSGDDDEVEDLHAALTEALRRFPGVQAVCSGAILSTYQRVRIENVCGRLGLASLSPLWRRDTQHRLLRTMVDDAGLEAVLVRVAAPPGLQARHLNRNLRELQPLFRQLYDRYQFSVCGEGGEFETLVLDCPLYGKRLVLDETEIVETENDGVAELKIISCHAEPKDEENVTRLLSPETASSAPGAPMPSADKGPDTNARRSRDGRSVRIMPRTCRGSGGLFYVSEIMAPSAARPMSGQESEQDLAVIEASRVLEILSRILVSHGATAQDVMMVNLYLSEMSHFAAINQRYREFFGTVLPPSRSCIGIGAGRLPGGRRVVLDCIVQCGSGQYMRAVAADQDEPDNFYAQTALCNTHTRLREVLHVQSISFWAPVCVGPYSQANTFRDALHFVAGQIGLRPETMTLRRTWTEQLEQAWTNAARILDALRNGSLSHVLSGLIYVTDSVLPESSALTTIEAICHHQISTNGGVVAGELDGNMVASEFCGYEDEGTMRECMGEATPDECPVLNPHLVVSVPQLPLGAMVEVEILAATSTAVSSSPLSVLRQSGEFTSNVQKRRMNGRWAGYDPFTNTDATGCSVSFDAFCVSLGHGFVGSACVTASCEKGTHLLDIETETIFGMMIDELSKLSQCSASAPDLQNVLHFRLFHMVGSGDTETSVDDGLAIRMAFQSAVSACFGGSNCLPCISIIPVTGLYIVGMQRNSASEREIIYAMRASIMIDPIELETERWIRANR